MKTSKLKDSVKAVLASLGFLLAIFLIGRLIMLQYDRVGAITGTDYDTVFIGSSFVACAIDPETADSIMGTHSASFGIFCCDMRGRYAMLESAAAHNPIKTAYIDVPISSLIYIRQEKEFVAPAVYTVRKIKGPVRKLRYLGSRLNFFKDEYDYYALTEWDYGINSWNDYRNGKKNRYWGMTMDLPTHDLSMTPEEAAGQYHTEILDQAYIPEYCEELQRIVDFCREHEIELVFTVMPYSERYLLKKDGWDAYYTYLSAYAGEQGVPLFDFNLLKERYTCLSDQKDWKDEEHLSRDGKELFCPVICETLLKRNDVTDWSEYFYPDYEEALKHTAYSQTD